MKRSITFAVAILLIAVVSACGGKPSASAVPKPTDTVVPTYVYQAPTEPPVFALLSKTQQPTEQVASSTEAAAATADPELITRGQGRYVALVCGSCHGDQGQGTDKGSALVPLKLDEDGFVKFLQTGGGLGNAHLFAGNKLSPTGAHNLYLYIVSLAKSTATP